MAQGDGYVYDWTSYNNNSLSLTPSSGIEWMFVSFLQSNASAGNGICLNASSSTSSAYTYSTWHNYTGSTSINQWRHPEMGGTTTNLKMIATNSKPMVWRVYNNSTTQYSKYMAIVINE